MKIPHKKHFSFKDDRRSASTVFGGKFQSNRIFFFLGSKLKLYVQIVFGNKCKKRARKIASMQPAGVMGSPGDVQQ